MFRHVCAIFRDPFNFILLEAIVNKFQPSGKANRGSYWASVFVYRSLCMCYRVTGPARGVWGKGAVLRVSLAVGGVVLCLKGLWTICLKFSLLNFIF
jgi:hypothetical protein